MDIKTPFLLCKNVNSTEEPYIVKCNIRQVNNIKRTPTTSCERSRKAQLSLLKQHTIGQWPATLMKLTTNITIFLFFS